jgi:hypothetical protein
MKLIVTPMIGEVRQERLDSLRTCHAIYERQVIKRIDGKDLGKAVDMAIKELLLADRARALEGRMSFIVEISTES